MDSKKVLVTGGAGYIGSHACKALAQAGYQPITFDNLSRGNRVAVKWGPLEIGDIRDRAAVLKVLKTHEPVAILHFAALAYVGESVTHPLEYYDNNLLGSLSLIQASVAAGIEALVFSSTCATYGAPRQQLIDESHPQQPINPYGQSKLCVEQILRDVGHATRLRYMNLRYFNAAGADSEAEIGEMHDPETHLIPLAIAAASGSAPGFTIYGSDYDTPDGTCVRDYIHVSDLARAHVLGLKYLLDGNDSVSLNLGTGVGFSNREVVEKIDELSGAHIRIQYGARRAGDPASLVANPARASTLLGWVPEQSDIDNIVRTAWNWHKLNINVR